MNGVFVADHFDGVGLCHSTGNELEACLATEVLEGFARLPADVDGLNVVGVEVIGSLGSLSLESCLEVAEVAELDAFAFEQEFLQAIDCLGEETHDVASAIDAAVIGDVAGEVVDIDLATDLRDAERFGLGDVGFLGTGLSRLLTTTETSTALSS